MRGSRRVVSEQDWVEMVEWFILLVRGFVNVESTKWPGDGFCCMGRFVYVLCATRSRVSRRVWCWTLSYSHRGCGAALTPVLARVKTTFGHKRRLIESSSEALNVIVGSPRNIPGWCTVTNPLVREGGGPNPQRMWAWIFLNK